MSDAKPRVAAGLGTVVTFCTLAQALTIWSVFFFPPIAVVVTAELGLDPVYVGYQTGLLFAFTICATLYSGALVDRLGPTGAMLLGLLLALVGLGLYAGGTITLIVLGSLFVGVGFSLINPSSLVLLRQVTGASNRSFVFSLKQSSVPLGMLVSSFVGPFLAIEHGWRAALAPPLVLLCLLALLLLRLLPRSNPRPRRPAGRGLAQPLYPLAALGRNHPLLLLALAGTALGICQGSVVTFTSNLFADERGLSLKTAGLILACVQLGAICARPSWGLLADRIRNTNLTLRIVAALMAVELGAMALLPAGLPVWLWCVLHFFLGTAVMGWNGLLIAEFARNIGGAHRSAQMAGAFFVLFSGGSLGSLGFAFVHQFFSSYAHTMGALGCVFSLVAFALIASVPKSQARASFQPLDAGL